MTLSTQFLTMLTMIGMGSFFGAALDTYNRFLNRTTRKQYFVFINDILFWILQGLIIFYVLFIVNEGELRFYIFIALLCGFAAYQSLLKGYYLKILETTISIAISLWNFLAKLFQVLVYRPLLSIISLLISIIFSLGRGLLSLTRFLGRVMIWMGRVVLKPVQLILLLFWKLLPKRIKKNVEKLYNNLAGIYKRIKNSFLTMFTWWKNRKK
jgi:spore cortex biosynthesis protein YabQ